MTSNTEFTIEVTKEEADVISELFGILEGCPIALDDHDYCEIIRSIANRSTVPDLNDAVYIRYGGEEDDT